MPKKPRVRTLMDGQHVKMCERLLKSERQYFSHVFWSLWQEISSKSFVLLVSEIFDLFINILTLDDKYCLSVKRSVQSNQVKWNYLKIKKYFPKFFHFRILHRIRITLEKRMSLTGHFILKL